MTPEVDSLTVHWTDPSGTTTPVGTLTTSGTLAQQTLTYVTSRLADQGFGIGEDLPPVPGPLRPPGGAASFGTITDSGPDAWGRRIIAAKTGTVVRNDTDAVIRAADATRQGALRYSRPPDGTFLTPEGEAESVTALPELLDEVEAFQHGEFTGSAVARILRAGTSGRRFVVACAALNVCVNNVDDHPRNFGFLRHNAGWAVAPVFDVVPWLRPGRGRRPESARHRREAVRSGSG